jgi:hypothetical protein
VDHLLFNHHISIFRIIHRIRHHTFIPYHIDQMSSFCTQNGRHIVPNVFQSPGPVLVIDKGLNHGLLEVILSFLLVMVAAHQRKVNLTRSRLVGHSLMMLQVKHTKFQVGLSPDRYNISIVRASHGSSASSMVVVPPGWFKRLLRISTSSPSTYAISSKELMPASLVKYPTASVVNPRLTSIVATAVTSLIIS